MKYLILFLLCCSCSKYQDYGRPVYPVPYTVAINGDARAWARHVSDSLTAWLILVPVDSDFVTFNMLPIADSITADSTAHYQLARQLAENCRATLGIKVQQWRLDVDRLIIYPTFFFP